MKAIILAGGLGTRLRGVVDDKPKPMVRIGGKPFLEYLLLQLKQFKFEDIILSTGYLSEEIEDYFGNGDRWGVNILYSREKKALGTGGAVKLAEDLIEEDDFLVMNGDSFLDTNLRNLINFHHKKKALASMALVKVENPKRYGLVEIDKDKRIVDFIEKEKTSESNLINGGVYVFNKAVLDEIPDNEKVSLEKEIFPKLIGKNFYGMPTDDYFIDIGTPEDYIRLKKNPQVLLRLRKSMQGAKNEHGRSEFMEEASSAITSLRKEVIWKPGKDVKHLEKRIKMGHLSPNTSLADYNSLIRKLIGDDSNPVYLYKFATRHYYAVRGKVKGADWLVIFGKDGVMETAFPPWNIDNYIESRGFILLGKIKEVVR